MAVVSACTLHDRTVHLPMIRRRTSRDFVRRGESRARHDFRETRKRQRMRYPRIGHATLVLDHNDASVRLQQGRCLREHGVGCAGVTEHVRKEEAVDALLGECAGEGTAAGAGNLRPVARRCDVRPGEEAGCSSRRRSSVLGEWRLRTRRPLTAAGPAHCRAWPMLALRRVRRTGHQ